MCGFLVRVYSAQAPQKFHFIDMEIYKYLFLKTNMNLSRDWLMAADILRRLGA
jgi:hypothetical protein